MPRIPLPTRPRAVWAALVTGVLLVVLIAVVVAAPIIGLIGAADAASVGALDVPVGSIVAAFAIGYLLAIALLALCAASRRGPLAWIASVAAVTSALVVSLWPLIAVAMAGVDQAGDLLPFIASLVERATGG